MYQNLPTWLVEKFYLMYSQSGHYCYQHPMNGGNVMCSMAISAFSLQSLLVKFSGKLIRPLATNNHFLVWWIILEVICIRTLYGVHWLNLLISVACTNKTFVRSGFSLLSEFKLWSSGLLHCVDLSVILTLKVEATGSSETLISINTVICHKQPRRPSTDFIIWVMNDYFCI